MTFFPIADEFALSPTAVSAGNGAVGLWARAGGWSTHQLTDGHIPAEVARLLGTPAEIKSLVRVGLWAPDPERGGFVFTPWPGLTRAGLERKRAEAAGRKRASRARHSDADVTRDIPVTEGVTHASVTGSVTRESWSSPDQTKQTPLLTMAGRLSSGDARGAPPPAEQVALWQDLVGPDVDLEAEARAYLERNLDRPARDERGAWLGWLREARRRADAARPAPSRPPCSAGCESGWLDWDTDHPRRCPTCTSHLRPVAAAS